MSLDEIQKTRDKAYRMLTSFQQQFQATFIVRDERPSLDVAARYLAWQLRTNPLGKESARIEYRLPGGYTGLIGFDVTPDVIGSEPAPYVAPTTNAQLGCLAHRREATQWRTMCLTDLGYVLKHPPRF